MEFSSEKLSAKMHKVRSSYDALVTFRKGSFELRCTNGKFRGHKDLVDAHLSQLRVSLVQRAKMDLKSALLDLQDDLDKLSRIANE